MQAMWQAFRQTAQAEDGQSLNAAAADTQQSPEEDPCYYCLLCGELITRRKARISVQGAHEHRFSNPAGYVFDIGCFRTAPGCQPTGDPNDFYSWFDGYAWLHALCRGCGSHLGWAFVATGRVESFFGLILNRLAASPDGPPARS